MDGYKKIKFSTLLLIILLAGFACQTIQKPAGSYLYVDDSDSIIAPDSVAFDTNSLKMENVEIQKNDKSRADTFFEKPQMLTVDTSKSKKLVAAPKASNDTVSSSISDKQEEDKQEEDKQKEDKPTAKSDVESDVEPDTVIIYTANKKEAENNDAELNALQDQYESRIQDLQEIIQLLKENLNEVRSTNNGSDTVLVSQKVIVEKAQTNASITDSLYANQNVLKETLQDSLEQLNKEIEKISEQNELLAEIAYVKQPLTSNIETVKNERDSLLAIYRDRSRRKSDSIKSLKKSLAELAENDSSTLHIDTIIKKDTVFIEEKKSADDQEKDSLKEALHRLRDSLKLSQKQVETLRTNESIPKQVLWSAYYDTNSLEASNWPTIQIKLNQMSPEKIKRVLISGHTDSSGPARINLQLSKRRTKAIENKLLNAGIAPEKIYSQSFGEKFASEQSIDKERRVEITIIQY